MVNDRLVQAEDVDWNGDEFQWSRRLEPQKTLEVRGFRGSIRALPSEDELIHVDGRSGPTAKAPVDILDRDNGIMICAGGHYPATKRENPPSDYDVPVDFMVRVPAGVLFEASMGHGDITVEKLRSAVNVATIEGHIRIQTAGFGAQANTIRGNVLLELAPTTDADFYGSTVTGTIDSNFPLVERATAVATPGPFLPMGSWTPAASPSRPPRIVEATIGQGGVALRVTVVHGNVQLRRS